MPDSTFVENGIEYIDNFRCEFCLHLEITDGSIRLKDYKF
ncbi:hypothetical protein SAMN04487772_10253 [[Clostridium] polysaccharolyticum]|uniref:Uncharacterized protein n=1 Tax=[Clostridium] polysaccharolyticum TaxID=29364 RepID=A0A1H9YJH9_9FIRM|nr:hypothetical protein SAMN04487772_10253 [[Clostridium] polysaccharolyticum]